MDGFSAWKIYSIFLSPIDMCIVSILKCQISGADHDLEYGRTGLQANSFWHSMHDLTNYDTSLYNLGQ
jgi:hypothetical protein